MLEEKSCPSRSRPAGSQAALAPLPPRDLSSALQTFPETQTHFVSGSEFQNLLLPFLTNKTSKRHNGKRMRMFKSQPDTGLGRQANCACRTVHLKLHDFVNQGHPDKRNTNEEIK